MGARLLVVPSARHLEAALCARGAGGPHLGERPAVVTMAQLEGALCRSLMPGVRVASRPLVRVLLRRAVRSLPRARAEAETSGLPVTALLEAAERSVVELSAAGLSAPAIRAVASRCESERARERGLLLADCMEGLQAELSTLRLLDPRAASVRLAEAFARALARPADAQAGASRRETPGEVTGASGGGAPQGRRRRGRASARAEPHALLEALDARLDAGIDLALGGAREVEVRDPAGASPARLMWLERLHLWLSRRGGSLTITLPTAQEGLFDSAGIEDPRELVAARLERRMASLADPPALVHRPAGDPDTALGRLAQRVFAGPRAPVGPVQADSDLSAEHGAAPVELFAAADAEVAASVAACEVVAALRRGTPPSEIAIALPTLDEEAVRPLRRALRSHGVPLHEPRGPMPAMSPSISTLLGTLRRLDRGLLREDLVVLLRSAPWMVLGPSGDAGLALARAVEAVPGRDLARDGEAMAARLPEELAEPFRELLGLLARASAAPRFAEVLGRARVLGERMFPPARLTEALRPLLGADDELLLQAAQDLAALQALLEALTEMARAVEVASAGDDAITFGELSTELEVALEARRRVVGVRAGAVTLARLRDRVGLTTRVLVLLETHEDALPARPAPDPLLARPLLDALREADPRTAPPPRSLLGAVDLLCAVDAIGHTRERLVMVHRRTDGEGRPLQPGPLFREVARLTGRPGTAARSRAIPAPGERSRGEGEETLRRHHARAAEVLRAASAPGARDGDKPVPAAIDPDAWSSAVTEVERARRFARGPDERPSALPPLPGALGERLRARLGGDEGAPLSVSLAEALLACPFLPFSERVLGARGRDAVDEDGGALEAGSLVHEALHRIEDALRQGTARTPDEVQTLARREAERALAPAEAVSALQRVRRERLVDRVVELVALDLERATNESRRYLLGEVAFGPGKAWPPLRIDPAALPPGGGPVPEPVFVSGQIDRIDVEAGSADGRATVIDYKARVPSGTTQASIVDDPPRGVAQLALYARAAAAHLDPKPVAVSARFLAYQATQVGPPVGTTRAGDDAAWRALVGDAALGEGLGVLATRLAAAVSAFRLGEVTPRLGARCEDCAQRAACRAPRVTLEEGPEE